MATHASRVDSLANISRIVTSAEERVGPIRPQAMGRLLYAGPARDDPDLSMVLAARVHEDNPMTDSSEARKEHVQEDEPRRQIAYAVQHGLAQNIAGSVYRFSAFRGLLSQDSALAWVIFDTGLALLRQAGEELRTLIDELEMPGLEKLGLAAAVERFALGAPGQGSPAVQYEHNLQGCGFSATVERGAYRIIQEALTNARRHSRSANVRLKLFQYRKGLRISIEDWGVGFDPTKVDNSRVGLAGIREQAKLLGGHATVESASGKGTRIIAEIPIQSTSRLEDLDF